MSQERVSDLALLSIENNLAQQVDCDLLNDEFACNKVIVMQCMSAIKLFDVVNVQSKLLEHYVVVPSTLFYSCTE